MAKPRVRALQISNGFIGSPSTSEWKQGPVPNTPRESKTRKLPTKNMKFHNIPRHYVFQNHNEGALRSHPVLSESKS
jgi:hypothetical protein